MIAVCSLSLVAGKVNANPQGFYQSYIGTTPTFNGVQGSAGNIATSTIVYMTPGTATSTLYWDSQIGGASAFGSESASLQVAFTASSSVSTLQVNQEFSQGTAGVNCVATPTACDWYEGDQTSINNYVATTTVTTYNIGLVPQFSFLFASSTVGGSGLSTTNNLATRIITVQTPVRYSRFVFTLKVQANGNGGVWAGLVAKKQNQ